MSLEEMKRQAILQEVTKHFMFIQSAKSVIKNSKRDLKELSKKYGLIIDCEHYTVTFK